MPSGPSQSSVRWDVSRKPILVIRVPRGPRLASHDSGATANHGVVLWRPGSPILTRPSVWSFLACPGIPVTLPQWIALFPAASCRYVQGSGRSLYVAAVDCTFPIPVGASFYPATQWALDVSSAGFSPSGQLLPSIISFLLHGLAGSSPSCNNSFFS
jgi:hypothetical protein